MTNWLDRFIFGYGHGLSMPQCHQVFYWLVNTDNRRGHFYHWSGWFGSQLTSFQWTHPKSGERRKFLGLVWRPVHSRRSFLRVSVSWATSVPQNIDEANAFLRTLRAHVSEPGQFDYA